MSRDRLSNAAQGGAPEMISSRERMRLGVLAGIAAMMTGVVLFFSSKEQGAEPSVPNPTEVEAPNTPSLPPVIPPWNPPVEVLNAVIKEASAEDRVRRHPKELARLAEAARLRPLPYFIYDPTYASVGGFERVPTAELFDPAKSADLRCRPVEVTGTLKEFTLPLPAEYGLNVELFRRPLHAGILDVDGREVRFLTVDDESPLVPVGLRYKAMGIFYRLIDEERTEGEYATRAFLITKKLVRPVPLALVETLPESLADQVKGVEAAALAAAARGKVKMSPHHERQFMTLAGYLLNHKEGLFPTPPPMLRGREPLSLPDQFRLKPVRIFGELIWLKWESFEYEHMRAEDAPVLGYWHAMVGFGQPTENVPISVAILCPKDELPANLQRFAEGTPGYRPDRTHPRIQLDGYYYRVHAYDARGKSGRGGITVSVPLVLSASIPSVSFPKVEDTTRPLVVAFVGGGMVLVLLLIVMLLRDRSKRLALDAKIRTSRVTRRKSQGFDLNRVAQSAREEHDPE